MTRGRQESDKGRETGRNGAKGEKMEGDETYEKRQRGRNESLEMGWSGRKGWGEGEGGVEIRGRKGREREGEESKWSIKRKKKEKNR